MARKTETSLQTVAFERSSGNVFADLGLAEPGELKTKLVLAVRLNERMLTALGDDSDGFLVVPGENANHQRPAIWLKGNALANVRVEHARMGACLMQKSQSLDDPIVEIEQLPALGCSASSGRVPQNRDKVTCSARDNEQVPHKVEIPDSLRHKKHRTCRVSDAPCK